MTDQKSWRQMLTALDEKRSVRQVREEQDIQSAHALVDKLYTVFDCATAGVLAAFIDADGRKRERLHQDARNLCDEILIKVSNETFSMRELNVLGVTLMGLSPADSVLQDLLKSVSLAVSHAADKQAPADEARQMAAAKEEREMEIAVFKRYLAQNPDNEKILRAMMHDAGHLCPIEDISKKSGLPLTPADLQKVIDEVTPIFKSGYGSSVFDTISATDGKKLYCLRPMYDISGSIMDVLNVKKQSSKPLVRWDM